MRIAYLDCFAGISGDMFLGALLDAGLSPQVLHDTVASLNIGASLKIDKVDLQRSSSWMARLKSRHPMTPMQMIMFTSIRLNTITHTMKSLTPTRRKAIIITDVI